MYRFVNDGLTFLYWKRLYTIVTCIRMQPDIKMIPNPPKQTLNYWQKGLYVKLL